MSQSTNYWEYLGSIEWQKKRDEALERAGYCCEHAGCENDDDLQVHHLSYERLGYELLSDVIVLCEYHHKAYEARRGNAPSECIEFDEWAVINFGEDWKDTMASSQAHDLYRDYLISEFPLET
jgi:hypothetical protein